MTCGNTDQIKDNLDKRFGEKELFEGIGHDGNLVELLVDRSDRSWTILETEPGSERSCILDAGTKAVARTDHIELSGGENSVLNLFQDASSNDWQMSIKDITGQLNTLQSGEWGTFIKSPETDTRNTQESEPISLGIS